MRRAGSGRVRPLGGGMRSRISQMKVAAAKAARLAPPSIAIIRAGGQARVPEQSLAAFHRSTALSKPICRFGKFSSTAATVRRSLKWPFSPVKINAEPIRGMPKEFARRWHRFLLQQRDNPGFVLLESGEQIRRWFGGGFERQIAAISARLPPLRLRLIPDSMASLMIVRAFIFRPPNLPYRLGHRLRLRFRYEGVIIPEGETFLV
jgi:hypothetical protein